MQSHIALRKNNRALYTAEQHLNQLKVFAEKDLTDHRSPSLRNPAHTRGLPW
jgi:hypothetical protein